MATEKDMALYNDAVKAFDDCSADVANLAGEFLEAFEAGGAGLAHEDGGAELKELRAAIKKRDDAQVVLLQTMRGIPQSRAVEASLRGIEMTLAYEMAVSVIESSCVSIATNDRFEELDGEWYDLDSAAADDLPVDIENEVAYLDSRRLLLHDPHHPRWVKICDEGEPLAEAVSTGPSAADLDAVAAEAAAKEAPSGKALQAGPVTPCEDCGGPCCIVCGACLRRVGCSHSEASPWSKSFERDFMNGKAGA